MACKQNRKRKPLVGVRVAVTRAREQAGSLVAELERLGAEVVEIPTIRIEALDPSLLVEKLRRLDSYDFVIFTSANGVETFFQAFCASGLEEDALRTIKIAAVGRITASMLERRGFPADLVPDEFLAEGLVDAIGRSRHLLENGRVLLPRAEQARNAIVDELERLGIEVDDVPVYRTVPEEFDVSLLDQPPHVILFASSSAACNLASRLPPSKLEMIRKKSVAACIGPVTAKTARDLGFRIRITPGEYTIAALMDAVVDYFERLHREDRPQES